MLLKSHTIVATASILVLASTVARADVTISSDATQNMSCVAGICQPSAGDAVLNVSDLESLLTVGTVTVSTTGSGVQAGNIDVTSNLSWSTNTLTLDAYQSISVAAPMNVNGKSGLSLLTDDGGRGGQLVFFSEGRVRFKKLSATLSINGTSYNLVNSIGSLASAAQENPYGSFALANDYDAKEDGNYGGSPISRFAGTFNGLGNAISHFTVRVKKHGQYIGLFGVSGGKISSVRLIHTDIADTSERRGQNIVGTLVGANSGTIFNVFANGRISVLATGKISMVGGLVGHNEESGYVLASSDSEVVNISTNVVYTYNYIGGLAGGNEGFIDESFSTGSVTTAAAASIGGLIGTGSVGNCYATGAVTSSVTGAGNTRLGGLIGWADDGGPYASYSTGSVAGTPETIVGGLIGIGDIGGANDYWDTETSGTDDGMGGENVSWITGLTTAQFQSGLPDGFDPAIWGEDADINGGFPYLVNNPPPQ